MTDSPSRTVLARIAVGLLLGLVITGIIWYGISVGELERFWRNIVTRPSGPMTFRFILQPTMSSIAALRDGIKDARLGRAPYLFATIRRSERRTDRLWEGIVSTEKILILGVVMDVACQLIFFGTLHPAEAAVVAILLAFVPYAVLRGPVNRIARHWVCVERPTAPKK